MSDTAGLMDVIVLISNVSDPHKAVHLRQSVQLTGLETDTFGCAIESIVLIHTFFSRQFKEGLLEGWKLSVFGESQALDTSNRYFSSRRKNPHVANIPFEEYVDPDRILSDLTGTELIHCEENKVRYFEFMPHEDQDGFAIFCMHEIDSTHLTFDGQICGDGPHQI